MRVPDMVTAIAFAGSTTTNYPALIPNPLCLIRRMRRQNAAGGLGAVLIPAGQRYRPGGDLEIVEIPWPVKSA